MKTSKIVSTFLFILNNFYSFSQLSFTEISGKVTDEKLQPIEFANVFINNTSIGTTTDANGNFKLNIPNNIPTIELIISFVGFEKIKEKIILSGDGKRIFNFKMKGILMQEVKVTAKRDKNYKRKWEIFKNILLGQSEFTEDCEITNADNLRFEEASNGDLLVSAPEPFYVINNALGYKVRIDMSLFRCNEKKWMGIFDEFFEKINPINDEQESLWRKNRVDAFESSFRNFLISLEKGDTAKSNFIIFQRDLPIESGNIISLRDLTSEDYSNVEEKMDKRKMYPLKISDFYFYDNQRSIYTLFSKKELLVFLKNKKEINPPLPNLPYQVSSVILPLKSMTFNKNGWMIKPNGVVLGGYWAKEGVSIALPIDFTLE